MHKNFLSGLLPTEIGVINELSKCMFQYLTVTHTINVPHLHNAPSVSADLSLYGNELSGTIPTEILLLTNLGKFSVL